MKAVLTRERFSDPGWIFERKLDGIRCVAVRTGERVRLLSRNERPLNARYPEVAGALQSEPYEDFALDGEIVAFEGSRTSFARLAQRGHQRVPVFFYVFDLTWLDGYDLRGLPLRTRKRLLRASMRAANAVRLTPHRNGAGEALFEEGCRKGVGGRHRQARGQPVHAHALARLDEVQVRAGAGTGDRRLHLAARLARGAGGAGRRLLRG
jgi:ATP-dependent DNA ligase